MKKYLFLACTLLASSLAFSQYEGKISKVYDGESFVIKLKNGDTDSVKLWGIDAPELKQQFGKASQKHLKALIHREVKLEYKTRDKRNFMIAIVTYKLKNGDIVNLNESLVRQGYAWKNKYTDNKKLDKLQKQAEKNNAGLWKNSDPTPPWEWRKANQ